MSRPTKRRSPARRSTLRSLHHRLLFLESLEPKQMLNGAPVAVMDGYSTPVNTQMLVGSGDHPLAENDWDPEGSSRTISIETQPDHGTISSLNTSTGTFTFTPDTNFVPLTITLAA